MKLGIDYYFYVTSGREIIVNAELKGIHVTEFEPQLFTQNVLRHDIPAQHYVGSASIDRGRTQKHPFTIQYARVQPTPTTISYHFYSDAGFGSELSWFCVHIRDGDAYYAGSI